MAQLEEGTFDGKEEDGGDGKNAELNADKRGSRSHRDIVSRTKLHNEMNNELLDEIGAVSNAGDEGDPWDLFSTQRRTRTHREGKKRGHAKSYERELPDAHGHGEVVGLTQIQAVSYCGQRR